MEANLKKCGIASYDKTYSRTMRKEEAQDCVVPDTLPDIAELATTWGSVLIRSKDVGEGRVRVEANVPAKVSFLPEGEGGLCCLDVNIPFYFSAEDAAIREGDLCVADLKLRTLETRVLNPRKVTVRAEVELMLECYEAGETVFYTGDEHCDRGVHVRERSFTVAAVGCVTEKTFVLTDELTLPPEQLPAETVLGQQADLCLEDVKSVGSKVILKGSVRSTVLYRTPEGETDRAEFSTEFSQIVDTEVQTEEAYTAVRLLLSGLYYDVAPGYNGRTLHMELHAVAQLTVYENHTVSCLTDAYSNIYALELQREQRALRRIVHMDTLRGTAREEISLPKPAAEVLCCTGECLGASREESGVVLTLRLHLCCRAANGAVFSASQQLTVTVQTDQAREGMLLHSVMLPELSAVPSEHGVELRCTAEVGIFVTETWEMDCIQGIGYDETALLDLSDRPSLVIMKVRSSDDLWQLARENCSTTEAIRSANGLGEETEPWEKLLLIPRMI